MLADLIRILVSALTWPFRGMLSWLRRRLLGPKGVIELELGAARSRGGGLLDTVSMRMALDEIADDPSVRALILRVRPMGGGWSTLGELTQALGRVRAAGKLVVAHLDVAGLRELYLVAGADRVWLTPSSQLMLTGMGVQVRFYADLLENLGVRADLVAAGSYKSFGEPYVRNFASQPNREQYRELLEDLQDQVLRHIAEGRRMNPDEVLKLLARSPMASEDAVAAGLVDGVAYADQVDAEVDELMGEGVRRVPFGRYARLVAWERFLERFGRRGPRVAVVHLEGPVVHGAEGIGGSGLRIDADRVVPVLDRLREAPQIKGVVLYVNSPGGSALASDVIARAVTRLATQKPVVSVFGDVSASGGYYLAAPSVEIVARPNTITGSIGVIGGKIVVGEGLARVGVHTETIAVGPDVGMFSPWTPFTDDQRERFKASLQRTYDRFIAIVSAGRRQPASAVELHARGRVWTGRQALERGLVDHLGGLQVGVARARCRAGLDRDAGPVAHIRFPAPRFRVLASLMGRGDSRGSWTRVADGALGEMGPLFQLLRSRPGSALALLPWRLDD